MNTHKLIIGLLAGTIFISLTDGGGAAADNDCLLFQRFKSLGSMTDADRVKVLGDGGEQFRLLGEALADQLERGPIDVKCYAAFLIGAMRCNEVAWQLGRWITLADPQWPRRQQREWPWDRYPAVGALIRIGKPSEKWMIENLETSDDEKVRAFSLHVIQRIEGQEIAEVVLRQAVEKQADLAKKAKLQAAFDLLKTGPPRPW